MSTELAEVPIALRSFKPRWGRTTTTTTTNDEVPTISVTSDSNSPEPVTYVGVPYVRIRHQSLPPTVGRVVLFEGTFEQVGHTEEAIATSRALSDFVTFTGALRTSLVPAEVAPSDAYEGEMVIWDTALKAAPQRPGGRLKVTLRRVGRRPPIHLEDPWD